MPPSSPGLGCVPESRAFPRSPPSHLALTRGQCGAKSQALLFGGNRAGFGNLGPPAPKTPQGSRVTLPEPPGGFGVAPRPRPPPRGHWAASAARPVDGAGPSPSPLFPSPISRGGIAGRQAGGVEGLRRGVRLRLRLPRPCPPSR